MSLLPLGLASPTNKSGGASDEVNNGTHRPVNCKLEVEGTETAFPPVNSPFEGRKNPFSHRPSRNIKASSPLSSPQPPPPLLTINNHLTVSQPNHRNHALHLDDPLLPRQHGPGLDDQPPPRRQLHPRRPPLRPHDFHLPPRLRSLQHRQPPRRRLGHRRPDQVAHDRRQLMHHARAHLPPRRLRKHQRRLRKPPPSPSSPPPTDSRAHRFATTRTRKSYSSASPTSPTGRAASTRSAAARRGRASRGRFSTTSGGTMWWLPMATATMAGIRTARAWGRPRIRGGRMVCAAYGTKGGTTALYAAACRLGGRHWRRGLGG